MIARLVQLAKAEGLQPVPVWSTYEVLVLEMTTGDTKKCNVSAILPQRGSNDAPGYLMEKGTNLQHGNRFRNAQVALADHWAAETSHALPEAVAEYLRSNKTIPNFDEWIVFALHGQIASDVPALRALTEALIVRTLEDAQCVSCGVVSPIVDLHTGVAAMGSVAPVLVSWNRDVVNHGEKRGGANLPTCVSCMWYYVQWLNKYVKWVRGAFRFHLDGYEWTLGNATRCGFVEDVVRLDSRSFLWEQIVFWQRPDKETSMKNRKIPEPIDRLPSETDDPYYMHGYLYGILEWATWVLRIPCPTAQTVVSAPARHLGVLIMAVRDGAANYMPPPKAEKKGKSKTDEEIPCSDRFTVTSWLHNVLHFATTRVTSFLSEPILPSNQGAFALGYAHSLGRRGPSREDFTVSAGDYGGGRNPTRWAIWLGDALLDRGIEATLEHEVSLLNGRKAFLDIAIPHASLAIEVDGRLHGLKIRNHVADSRRTAELLKLGWRIHRVPNKRLNRPDDIAAVADEVVEILAMTTQSGKVAATTNSATMNNANNGSDNE